MVIDGEHAGPSGGEVVAELEDDESVTALYGDDRRAEAAIPAAEP